MSGRLHDLRRWWFSHFGRITLGRCAECGKLLTNEEREFYSFTCERCEGVRMRALQADETSESARLMAGLRLDIAATARASARKQPPWAAIEANVQRGNWVIVAPDGRSWALNDFERLLREVRSELAGTDGSIGLGRDHGR